MKKIQNNILIALGVIGIQLLIYFFIFKPINSGAPLSDTATDKEINNFFPATTTVPEIPATPTIPKLSVPTTTTFTEVEEGDYGVQSFLTEEQEKALETFGIDPSKLPGEMTPEIEECFIEKLGEERVMEIIGGATPNVFDFFKAGSCFNI